MIKGIEALLDKYPRYHQIALLMEKDNDPFIEKLKAKNPEILEPVYQEIRRDQQRGLLRNDISPILIYDILEVLQKSLFMKAVELKDYQSLYSQAQTLFKVIHEGLKA